MYFKPGKHKNSGLKFNPLKAIISPRPIGWISSRGSDGSVNLAPYSYFNVISEFPPMVIFSSAPGSNSQYKDSLRNVIETSEFVANVVSSKLANKMNTSSKSFKYGESEFEAAKLAMSDCVNVSVPRVSAAPAALECKLWKTIALPKPTNLPATIMVIGTVTGIHIKNSIIKDGKIDIKAYKPVARLGYKEYTRVDNIFEMDRPV